MPFEKRTARLTVLVDPDKKAVFEQLCAAEDTTPSQMIRQLIRNYLELRLGRPWQPGERSLAEAQAPDTATDKTNAQAKSGG